MGTSCCNKLQFRLDRPKLLKDPDLEIEINMHITYAII